MIRHRSKRSFLTCAAVALVAGLTPGARPDGHQAPQTDRADAGPERIVINDNRTSAGRLVDGIVTVRLEARLGTWHPDGETEPGTVVKAFAVDGGPLQVPGPVIRVPEGTEIRVAVRNNLGDSLALHGLYSRPGTASSSEALTVASGELREIAFTSPAADQCRLRGPPDAPARLLLQGR